MDKLKLLHRIQYLYNEKNININSYLKEISNENNNSLEDILISYDFQAGTYYDVYFANPQAKRLNLEKMLKVINEELDQCKSIIEIGVGEATTLGEIITSTNYKYEQILGLDLSWSRIKYAKKFLRDIGLKNERVDLFTGDLFNLPLADNSIDLVYTFHAIESNGGRESDAIQELYRITNRYLILVEPSYEIASQESKDRMDKLGYVKDLDKYIAQLGYKVIINEPMGNDINPLNPAKIIVIEKQSDEANKSAKLCCPITKTPLIKLDSCYYSKESLLAYPILEGIPCFLSNNAIISTKMLED